MCACVHLHLSCRNVSRALLSHLLLSFAVPFRVYSHVCVCICMYAYVRVNIRTMDYRLRFRVNYTFKVRVPVSSDFASRVVCT